MTSTRPADSPCTWVLVCEVARGLLAANQVDNPESFLKHLADAARGLPAALGWARRVLEDSAERDDLDYWFGEITSEPEQRRRAYLNHVLCAELLLERRHAAQHVCLALCDLLPNSRLQLTDIRELWSAVDRAEEADFEPLDQNIARLVADTESAYALARAFLQRVLCWPLFAPVETPNAAGYSLPLAVVVDPRGTDHYKIKGALVRCVPPEALAIVRPSFESASKAGKQAWRAKHGRVYRPTREQVTECTVIFDFSPADLALRCLRDGDDDFVGRTYRGFVRREQRSIEAYLGQATLTRLLGRRFSSRAIATGCLEPPGDFPGERLAWRVCWTHENEILLSTLLQKARHVGSHGTLQRLVVPSEPSDLFTALQENLRLERESGRGLPYVIGAQELSTIGDYCIPGQWRPDRFIRCHAALADNDRTPIDHDLKLKVLTSFRETSHRALYIHAPHQTTEVVATVAQYLRSTNKGYLDRQNEARRDGLAGRVLRHRNATIEIPSQIGYLVFRGVDYEYGLAFFAALYHALAGHVDGRALAAIDSAYDLEQSATTIAEWLNHHYAIEEPWEAPEILVLYGIEHLRGLAAWRESMDSEPTDAWDVLRRLPYGLDNAFGDERHAKDLRGLRLVVIDGSETPDPTLVEATDAWDVCLIALPAANPAVTATTPLNLPVAETALGLFRTPAPIGAVVKAAAMLREAAPCLKNVPTAQLLGDLVSRAQADGIRHGHGTFGLTESAATAARLRLEKELPPHVLFRAHIAIASNYAPWLGVGHLFKGPFPAAVPPDEWLLPERLTEIAYHIVAATEYLKRADPALALPMKAEDTAIVAALRAEKLTYKEIADRLGISESNVKEILDPALRAQHMVAGLRHARLRLLNLQYWGLADRIYLLRNVNSTGEESFGEWQRATSALSQSDLNALPFRTLHEGARTVLRRLEREMESVRRVSLLTELQGRLLPALRGAAQLRAPAATPQQLWMRTVVCMIETAWWIQQNGTISQEEFQDAAIAVDAAAQRGIRLSALGNCFEYIGDAYWHYGKIDIAREWYERGVAHTGDRHWRMVAKISILSSDAIANIEVLLGYVELLERYPSQVPFFCESLLSLLGIAWRKLANSPDLIESSRENEDVIVATEICGYVGTGRADSSAGSVPCQRRGVRPLRMGSVAGDQGARSRNLCLPCYALAKSGLYIATPQRQGAKLRGPSKPASPRISTSRCGVGGGCPNTPHGTGPLCRSCWGSNVLTEVQVELRALPLKGSSLQARALPRDPVLSSEWWWGGRARARWARSGGWWWALRRRDGDEQSGGRSSAEPRGLRRVVDAGALVTGECHWARLPRAHVLNLSHPIRVPHGCSVLGTSSCIVVCLCVCENFELPH